MPDQPVRLSTELDARLARLEDHREDLAKAWLLRLLERAPLDEIERLPTDRIARDLPELISDIVRGIGRAGEHAEAELEAPEYERASRFADFRGDNGVNPVFLARDVAALQTVLLSALSRELRDVEPPLFLYAVERLTAVLGAVQAAALEALLTNRSRELESLANTDPLTGLYNLRYLEQQLGRLLGMQKRYGHPFSLLLLDLDGLKRINDAHGHAAGDRALTGVAGALRETVRTVDTPARLGGDEFCVLAPHQTASRAEILADRVAAAVDTIRGPEGTSVAISIGVVSCPQHAVDRDRLLELADRAMYRAKASGQRVAVGPGEEAATEAEGRFGEDGR